MACVFFGVPRDFLSELVLVPFEEVFVFVSGAPCALSIEIFDIGLLCQMLRE